MQKAPGRLKRLPAVARVLESRGLAVLIRSLGRPLATELIREHLESLRVGIKSGQLTGEPLTRATRPAAVARAVRLAADRLFEPRPRPVINATGVVVHTNLGRATLSEAAAARLARGATGYADLEFDTGGGRRGNRLAHLEPLMARLFPGRAFTVVNNNAAAILLVLKALARRREVIVSRGELVEIGGSFRVPDILAASGARLVEVGTTNRTRVSDYRQAIGERTGALLKVHTSNFRIVGFTEETDVRALARLKGPRLPLIVDWGSGNLIDLEPLDLPDELPVSRLLADGADLVTFSGDKLLGGPQAGFIVGDPDLVQRVKKDPLARAMRLDRLRIGALHETLAAYVRGTALEEVPTLKMLAATPTEIERRARRIKRDVTRSTPRGKWLSIVDGVSRTGGGSSPLGERPTRLLSVSVPGQDAGTVEAALRAGDPPIVGRLHDGRLLLDPRTVLEADEGTLAQRLAAALDQVREP